MNWYRGKDGSLRFWLEPHEIEQRMEGELRSAGILPTASDPAVDIEEFVEQYLRVAFDQHAELPPDVLGLTEFPIGEGPKILVNRDLTASALETDDSPAGIRGRWRATVAHEAGHVILHRVLFEIANAPRPLFPEPEADPQSPGRILRCLKRDIRFRNGGGDWREVQANQAMAALLMPRSVFGEATKNALASIGLAPGELVEGSPQAAAIIARLAKAFEVSKEACAIRLANLGALRGAEVWPLEFPNA